MSITEQLRQALAQLRQLGADRFVVLGDVFQDCECALIDPQAGDLTPFGRR
jgi:hypothetical protein